MAACKGFHARIRNALTVAISVPTQVRMTGGRGVAVSSRRGAGIRVDFPWRCGTEGQMCWIWLQFGVN